MERAGHDTDTLGDRPVSPIGTHTAARENSTEIFVGIKEKGVKNV